MTKVDKIAYFRNISKPGLCTKFNIGIGVFHKTQAVTMELFLTFLYNLFMIDEPYSIVFNNNTSIELFANNNGFFKTNIRNKFL